MANAAADREDLIRSVIIWAIALAAAIVVAFIVGKLFGLGAPPGLIFGAAVFIVLPYLVPARRKAAEAVAPAAHGHAEAAALVTLADMPGEAPAEAPAAAAISERVREAARAAGEAARALAGDDAAPVGVRPATLAGPRDGTPDNLRRLKGVGPKFEVVLHELGVFHFDQIAGWGPEEIAWIDANLDGFTGRVVREDWVGQAAILAAGGETEHSQRVDRGEST